MSNSRVMNLLKTVMCSGLCLIAVGIYLHMYNQTIEEMGIHGIIISAACVAFGMILSLPTKMVITFLLVKRESKHSLQVTDNIIKQQAVQKTIK